MENNSFDNPYNEPLDSISQETEFTDAVNGKRFGNYLLDIIAFYLFAMLLGVLAGALGMADAILNMNEYVFGILLIIIYYFGIEAATGGRSVGKYITKTKVIMEDGSTPGVHVFFLRTLCRLIPFDSFSIFFNGNRCWHDTITKTRVVNL